MDSILTLLNIFLGLSIIGFIFYFLDRKVINKKYYSAYKKAYDYVFLTLKEEDKDRVLKNLKEFQKEILNNAQFILTEGQEDSKAGLEKKRLNLLALTEKLNQDKNTILSKIDKIHNEVSSEDIEKTFEKLKEELSEEIIKLTELIKSKEDSLSLKINTRNEQLAKLKSVEFATKSVNEYSNLIMNKFQNLANLLIFYVIIAIEYLISLEFFTQLIETEINLLGITIPFGLIIPFLVTTLLLIAIDFTVNFLKEKKETESLITGLFAFSLFFSIAYSRVYPQLEGDIQILMLEIIKLTLFVGVIGLNYFLMDKYKIKSEDLLFAPFQLIKVLIELVFNILLKLSSTSAKVASNNINVDKISFERDLKKLNLEIENLKEDLNKKLSKRNDLNLKKDEEINKRKSIVSFEYSKRLAEINSQATNAIKELAKMDKVLGKNIEFDSQIKNGSYDGTSAAVKKIFKIN